MPVNLTNAPQPVTICGRQFLFTELVDNDHDTLNNWCRTRYLQTVRSSFASDMSVQDKQFELSLAHKQASAMTWMDPVGAKIMLCLDGVAMMLYVSVRRNHPQETFETLRAMLYDKAAESKINARAHHEVNEGIATANSLQTGESADPQPSN